jgi:uncharacterized membrane-anchored protein YhcB (DUF1043 family)
MNDNIVSNITDRDKKMFWNGIFVGIIIGILIIAFLLTFLQKIINN